MLPVTVGVVLAFIGLIWIAIVATANNHDPWGGTVFNFVVYSAPGFAVLSLGMAVGVWG